MAAVAILGASISSGAPPYVTVHGDGWHLTLDGASLWFPMGSNYIVNDQGFAPDYFGDCYWSPDKFERDFQAMEDLQLNTVKIMVPFTRLLTGPQGPDLVTLDEVTLRRLDLVIKKAGEHDLKLIIATQHGWGKYLEWYTAPGGQRSERLRNLVEDTWRQLVTRVNTLTAVPYNEDPTIMAWSLSVEVAFDFNDWDGSMPPLWQDWLKRKYGTAAAVDAAWALPFGTHASFSQIELPYCTFPQLSCVNQWNGRNTAPWKVGSNFSTWRSEPPVSAHNESTSPVDSSNRRKLADYQLFRYTIAGQWIKVQADAIKQHDPNHLVEMGIHAFLSLVRSLYPNPQASCAWSGSPADAALNEGPHDVWPFDSREMLRFIDFLDVHLYPHYPFVPTTCGTGHGQWPNYPNDPGTAEYDDMDCTGSSGCGESLEFLRHLTRYAWLETGKPVIVGEMGQNINGADKSNLDRVKWFNTQIAYRTAGDASGWLSWTLTNFCSTVPCPEDGTVGPVTAWNGLFQPATSPTTPLVPTPWGAALADLTLRVFDTTPPPLDQFAIQARGTSHRPPNSGTHDLAGILTDTDYIRWIGGPLDAAPGVRLLDTLNLGPVNNSKVVDFTQPPNSENIALEQLDARIVSQTVPTLVVVGSSAYAYKVRVRNTGTLIWPGTTCLLQSGGFSVTCHALGSPVAPGAEFEFNLTLGAPLPGAYTYAWVMRETGAREFGEKLIVDVRSYLAASLGPVEAAVVGAGAHPQNAPSVKTYALTADRRDLVNTTSFQAFQGQSHGFGAKVAIGDLDGLAPSEIVVAHGPQQVQGSGPTTQLDIWRKDFTTTGSPTNLGQIATPFSHTLWGQNIAIGDVDGLMEATCGGGLAKRDELAVAAGPGPGYPDTIHVLKVNTCLPIPTYTLWKSITPGASTGGASVALIDYDGDGKKELVVGSGIDQAPATVRLYDFDGTNFVLQRTLPAWDSSRVYTQPEQDGILLESHSLFGGATGPSIKCNDPYRFGAVVAGGDLIPTACPGVMREEIIVGGGPVQPVAAVTNPGWFGLIADDGVDATFPYEWAGFGGTRSGAVGAAVDLFGDAKNVVVTAAGPDNASSGTLHFFGRYANDAQPVPDQRLLGRLEGLVPFGGNYGANVAGRSRVPGCILGLAAGSGSPYVESPGSPSFAAASLAEEVRRVEQRSFRSMAAMMEARETTEVILGVARSGDLARLEAESKTFRTKLAWWLSDPLAMTRLERASLDVDARCVAFVANSEPAAFISVPEIAPASGAASIQLDGSLSHDPDSTREGSDIIEWVWWVDDAYAGTGRSVLVQLAAGSHHASLTVTDTVGHTSTAELPIEVPRQ